MMGREVANFTDKRTMIAEAEAPSNGTLALSTAGGSRSLMEQKGLG
jgi:hypothetical protein